MNNLRQIGLAAEMYAQDYDNYFPYSSQASTGDPDVPDCVEGLLSPYCNYNNEIWICPSSYLGRVLKTKSTYSNNRDNANNADGTPKKRSRVANPSKSKYIADYGDGDYRDEIGGGTHPPGRNFLFVDGHVAWEKNKVIEGLTWYNEWWWILDWE